MACSLETAENYSLNKYFFLHAALMRDNFKGLAMPFFLMVFLLNFVIITFGMNNQLPNENLLSNNSIVSLANYNPKDLELSCQILTVLKECNLISKDFSHADIENLKMKIEQKLVDEDKAKMEAIVHFYGMERGINRDAMLALDKLNTEIQKEQRPSLLEFLRKITILIHDSHKANYERKSTLGSSIVFGGILMFMSVALWIISPLMCSKGNAFKEIFQRAFYLPFYNFIKNGLIPRLKFVAANAFRINKDTYNNCIKYVNSLGLEGWFLLVISFN